MHKKLQNSTYLDFQENGQDQNVTQYRQLACADFQKCKELDHQVLAYGSWGDGLFNIEEEESDSTSSDIDMRDNEKDNKKEDYK